MLGAQREVRRLAELRKLRCGNPSCGSLIGLGSWSLINIRRITKAGEEPSVYQVGCPRFWDREVCHFISWVVFVSPKSSDPESLALEAVVPHFESWCAHCKRPLDWGKAKIGWKEDPEESDFDEVELTLRCPMTWKERFSKIMGRRVIRHGHLRNVRWVKDDVDQDEDIPNYVPSDWLISPDPALV